MDYTNVTVLKHEDTGKIMNVCTWFENRLQHLAIVHKKQLEGFTLMSFDVSKPDWKIS